MDLLMENKLVVQRFNREVVQGTNRQIFEELMHPNFINHSAPIHAQTSEGMWNTFFNISKPAFPDLQVTILDQVAEGDLVTTRKVIPGTHLGKLFDIEPTGKKIEINVIDIVRIREGKYFEHWGLNTFEKVIAELS